MKITFTSVLVDNQQKALAFYTDVLGFQEKSNIAMANTPGSPLSRPTIRTGSSWFSNRTPTLPPNRSKRHSSPTASPTPPLPSPTSKPSTSGSLLRAWCSPRSR